VGSRARLIVSCDQGFARMAATRPHPAANESQTPGIARLPASGSHSRRDAVWLRPFSRIPGRTKRLAGRANPRGRLQHEFGHCSLYWYRGVDRHGQAVVMSGFSGTAQEIVTFAWWRLLVRAPFS